MTWMDVYPDTTTQPHIRLSIRLPHSTCLFNFDRKFIACVVAIAIGKNPNHVGLILLTLLLRSVVFVSLQYNPISVTCVVNQ